MSTSPASEEEPGDQNEKMNWRAVCDEIAGIVLDPTYSGKALHGFLKDVKANTESWKGRRVLFLHTGGLLSMFEKADQLQPLVELSGKSRRHPVAAG